MQVFYLIRFLVVVIAAGTFFYNSKLLNNLNAISRAIVGISITPLLISLNTYIWGLIWPGAPVEIFRWILPLIAILYLLIHKNYRIVLEALNDAIRIINNKFKTAPIKAVIVYAVTVLVSLSIALFYYERETIQSGFLRANFKYIFLFGYVLVLIGNVLTYQFSKKERRENVRHIALTVLIIISTFVIAGFTKEIAHDLRKGIVSHDEAHYCLQARIFVEERNSWEIDNYSEKYSDMILADDHGPLFPMLLADAYFFSDNELLPRTMNMAIVLTGLLFLIAIFNIGYIMDGKMGGLCAILLVLGYNISFHVLFNGMREPFRFIALYLFVAFYYSYITSLLKNDTGFIPNNKNAFKWALYVFVISYVGANGHGSNIIVMLSIHIVYTVIMLWKRAGFIEYIVTSFAELIAVCLCQYKTILRFIKTGNFVSTTSYPFRGTVVPDLISGLYSGEENNALFSFLTNYEKVVLAILVLAMLFFFYREARYVMENHRIRNHSGCQVPIILICLGMLLPLTGVYDFLGYSFKRYLITNSRYRMHYVIVISILTIAAIAHLNSFAKHNVYYVVIPVLMMVCALSIRTNVNVNSVEAEQELCRYYENACEIISEGQSGVIFVAREMAQFYFRCPTKLSTTEYFHPLYIARSEQEITQAIEELNIDTFVFDTKDGYYFYYDYLPFFAYLKNSKDVSKTTYDYQGYHSLDVYKLNLKTLD